MAQATKDGTCASCDSPYTQGDDIGFMQKEIKGEMKPVPICIACKLPPGFHLNRIATALEAIAEKLGSDNPF